MTLPELRLAVLETDGATTARMSRSEVEHRSVSTGVPSRASKHNGREASQTATRRLRGIRRGSIAVQNFAVQVDVRGVRESGLPGFS
jgi:hypothetical protein